MTQFSRRHLLGGAAAAAAAFAAAPFVGNVQRARAAQTYPAIGQIVTVRRNGLALHTYVAPDASSSVTTHIVETPNALVVIDSQVFQTFAGEAAAFVSSLGKPVELHVLSHAHSDHFLGANQFVDSPFVATPRTAEAVQASFDAGIRAQLVGLLGEAEVVPEADVRVPEAAIEAGERTIDGVTFTFEIVENAEADEQLIIGVPQMNTLIVQDLIYNANHFFPGTDRDNWIATLESLAGRDDFDMLFVGHGLPGSKGELDQAINYLRFVQATIADGADAEALVAALTETYPSYEAAFILSFWAQML